METLLDLLRQTAAQHATRPCVGLAAAEATQWWTYAELAERVERAAAALQARGVAKGDRVAIWGLSSPSWVAAFFAVLKAGGVVIPLDVNSRPEFVAEVLATTRAKMILPGRAQAAASAALPVPTLTIEEVADAPADVCSPVAAGPNDLAELVFTSGATSSPKGVMLTHRNIVADVNGASQVIPSLPRYRTLSVLPLSHMFEQTCGLFAPMLGGASVVYLPALQPHHIFRALEREGITCMVVVPQILTLFLNGIEREVDRQGKRRAFEWLVKIAGVLPIALRPRLFPAVHRKLGGRLEFFIAGGAYLDPALQRRWEQLGVRVAQGYGATEAAPILTANNLDRRVPGSAGRALPGVALRIADDGEILAHGDNITIGYWENPQQTAEALEGGWYHTGDIGEIDREGNLYLRGRKKSMIVLSSGLNVHSEDVEQTLRQDERVRDAVVLGVQKDGETQVHAVLLLHRPEDAADVVRTANRRLAPHQAIRGSTVWQDEDFPRTHTLKVRRSVVEEALAQQRSAVR